MDKNRVKRLADNPHYAMNDKELEQLAELLREEAKSEKEEETKKSTKELRKINKNRVTKTVPKLDKAPRLQEQSDVSV